MSISDMIKKSVLEGFSSDITTTKIVISLGIAFALSIYIFFIYRFNSKSQFYSKDFNKTLSAMGVITAAIVLAIQSNLVVSLGMVGALSIVRFRTAVKNPIDLLYLFWSISVGIICGAGLYEVAVIGCVVITALLFLLDFIGAPKAPYLLIVDSAAQDVEQLLLDTVRKYGTKVTVKSRNITKKGVNFVIELQTETEDALLQACEAIEGITAVSLLLHDGELRS